MLILKLLLMTCLRTGQTKDWESCSTGKQAPGESIMMGMKGLLKKQGRGRGSSQEVTASAQEHFGKTLSVLICKLLHSALFTFYTASSLFWVTNVLNQKSDNQHQCIVICSSFPLFYFGSNLKSCADANTD